jgi:hypothetical protein
MNTSHTRPDSYEVIRVLEKVKRAKTATVHTAELRRESASKIRGNMKESAYRAGAAGRPVTLVSASTGARGSAARASRARASRRPSFNTDGRGRGPRVMVKLSESNPMCNFQCSRLCSRCPVAHTHTRACCPTQLYTVRMLDESLKYRCARHRRSMCVRAPSPHATRRYLVSVFML